MEQTAVSWFWDKLAQILPFSVDTETGMKLYEAYKEAKEKGKRQIIDAHNNGKNILPPNENGEQYYNETYKKD